MNQLQNQVSPYLLQHRNNPVDWFPWCEDALSKAKTENKPIILSIGYAACHWCHVMEHESFENLEVAELMNSHYVCIKVDREERPDIDYIYMDALHAMGLQGGWPLNVFLMPDQKPFYGGTYFPKANWIQLLNSIQRAFSEHQSELQQSADGFAANLQGTDVGLYPLELTNIGPLIPSILAKIKKGLDPVFGGTHKAPKFPIPSLMLLLEQVPEKLLMDIELDSLADLQLTKMACGGIFDQVGGGFSRYSVDSEWFCPHFEKMLYDNGQLIRVYALAFQRTNNPVYKEVVKQSIDFLNRELKGENDIFYASLDADSEGVEGLFYVWTFEELNAIIPYNKHSDFYKAYSLSKLGNWEHGYNILFKKDALLNDLYQAEITALHQVRSKRVRPATDDKQLLAWNAYTSLGLLEAGAILRDETILDAAYKQLNQLITAFIPKGQEVVLHQLAFSDKPIYAFLDDKAALGLALVKAFELSGDVEYLLVARQMIIQIEAFHTKRHSLFNFHSNQNDTLIAPKFEILDSVCPSANSMVCELYLWMGFLDANVAWTLQGKDMLAAILEQAQANPIYFANWLRIHSTWIENPKAIIKFNPVRIKRTELIGFNAILIPIHELKENILVCIGDHCLAPCEDVVSLKKQLATI